LFLAACKGNGQHAGTYEGRLLDGNPASGVEVVDPETLIEVSLDCGLTQPWARVSFLGELHIVGIELDSGSRADHFKVHGFQCSEENFTGRVTVEGFSVRAQGTFHDKGERILLVVRRVGMLWLSREDPDPTELMDTGDTGL
jgi:hypothetical protein